MIKQFLTSIIMLASAAIAFSAQLKVPLRIMPLGDSITAGSYGNGLNGVGGYRAVLWSKCQEAGLKVDFVGTWNDPTNATFDADHQGWRGGRTDQLAAEVQPWLEQCHPDVILLQIGVNDVIQGAEPSEIAARLSRLLEVINETAPKTQVYVASILGVLEPNDYHVPMKKVRDYNTLIPEVVSTQARKGSRMRFVDMNRLAAFEPSDFAADHLHPSDSGYRKMAEVWFTTLKRSTRR